MTSKRSRRVLSAVIVLALVLIGVMPSQAATMSGITYSGTGTDTNSDCGATGGINDFEINISIAQVQGTVDDSGGSNLDYIHLVAFDGSGTAIALQNMARPVPSTSVGLNWTLRKYAAPGLGVAATRPFIVRAYDTNVLSQTTPIATVTSFPLLAESAPFDPTFSAACMALPLANNPPTANDDGPYAAVEDTLFNSGATSVLTNDTDPDSDPLTVSAYDATSVNGGTVVMQTDGTFTYNPATGFTGNDTFDYTASDGNGGTDTATVTMNVAPGNAPPTANDDGPYAATEDTLFNSGATSVLTNDTDPDSDPLTVSAYDATSVNGGTVVMQTTGTFTYNPAANFNGLDTFTYTASDGNGGTDTATVTMNVAAQNDPPTANNDGPYGTPEDTLFNSGATSVLTNDTDPDSDPLTVSAYDAASANGGAVVMQTTGTFTYDPPLNFNGIDTFTYTASDGNGGTDTATVTMDVGGANDAPVAVDDGPYATDEDVVLNVDALTGVLANDTDADSDPLTVNTYTQPLNGTVVVNLDGSFTYTPNLGYSGVDTFTYDATDTVLLSNTATVTINVALVNTDGNGMAVDDAVTGPMNEDLVIDVLANDRDPDGDPLAIMNVGAPMHGSAAVVGGKVVYTPPPGFSGQDAFYYTAGDPYGSTDQARVLVTIWAPVPACRDIGGEPNSMVYAIVYDGTVPVGADVYCRVLVQNEVYLRPAGEIGIQSIVDLGVLQAVEVFGIHSSGFATDAFSQGVNVCLKGSGKLLYLNAANMPRSPEWLASWSSGGYTCGTIPNAGTVILVP